MEISNDDFIRTTESRHLETVKELFLTLQKREMSIRESMKVGIVFPAKPLARKSAG